VSYLDELLAGYQQGLADDQPQPVQALQAALAEASNPLRRGALLGLLAQSLKDRASSGSNTNKTSSGAGSITPP
jgi:hypothetical protein